MDVRFSITLPREAYTVAVMRDVLGEALRSSGICEECISTIQLAASEACANAVDHGDPTVSYELTTHLEQRSCVVEVVNTGPEFDIAHVPLPELDAESGRGILLMRQLVDDVSITHMGEGATLVRLHKHLHRTEPVLAGCGATTPRVFC